MRAFAKAIHKPALHEISFRRGIENILQDLPGLRFLCFSALFLTWSQRYDHDAKSDLKVNEEITHDLNTFYTRVPSDHHYIQLNLGFSRLHRVYINKPFPYSAAPIQPKYLSDRNGNATDLEI